MSASNSLATDFDYLVKLGYPTEDVRQTLAITNGNKDAALRILARGLKKEDESWRKESDNDWLDGVSKLNLASSENSRALQKSPIYIRVSSYHRRNQEVVYSVHITLKNGKQWTVERRYSQFSALKTSLPLGTCMNFTNGFPMVNVFQFLYSEESNEFLEKRRHMLSEWIREMCLNEHCMTSTKVLDALGDFIEIQKHCGPKVTLYNLPSASVVNKGAKINTGENEPHNVPLAASPLLAAYASATEEAVESRKALFHSIPNIPEDRFPLTLAQLGGALPFKINIKKLACVREHYASRQADMEKRKMVELRSRDVDDAEVDNISPGGNEAAKLIQPSDNSSGSNSPCPSVDDTVVIDEKQLRKDLSRDRLVIQGRKVAGSDCDLEGIVDVCKHAMLGVVVKAGYQLSSAGGGAGGRTLGSIPPPPSAGRPTSGTNSGSVHSPNIRSPALSMLDHAAKAALQLIGRTESAFLSHTSLHEMIDIHGTRHNASEEGEFRPYLIVPEATLADPLVVNFRVQHRQDTPQASGVKGTSSGGGDNVPTAMAVSMPLPVSGNSNNSTPIALSSPLPSPLTLHEWCIVCEGEASTVYRLIDADSMQTLLQLRVTFVNSLFALPVIETVPGRGGAERVVDFRLKEGKLYIIVSRDTTTTVRDWKVPT